MDTLNKTILLVEDEAILALRETAILQREGYTVVAVSTGAAAVAAVTQQPIDLVLMDIELGPGLDGTQAAEAILKDHDLPLVFLSSHTEREVVNRTKQITAYGYIVKSAGETVLLASIEMAFKLHAAHALVRENRDALDEFFALVPDLVCMASPAGHFEKVNPAWERTLGYPSAELLTRPFAEFIHPDDVATTFGEVEKQLAGAATLNFFNRYRHKDGSYRWLEWTARPAKNGRLYAAARDVTERHRAEAALRANEERYKLVTDMMSDYIFRLAVQADGQVVMDFVSDNFSAITGRAIGEARTTDLWSDIFHPDDLGRALALLRTLMTEGGAGEVECRTVVRGGEFRWVHVTAQALGDPATGRPQAIIGAVKDITARKRAEESLRASEALLYETSRIARVGGWAIQLETQHLTWTEEVYRLHEVEPDYQPTVAVAIGFYTPASRPIITQAVERAINLGEPFDLELEMVTAKGRQLWVHAMGKANHVGGKAQTVSGTFQDVTERKLAEMALQESTALLKEAQRLARLGHYRLDIGQGTWISSEALNEIFGIPADYARTIEGWANIVHPADREAMMGYFGREVVQAHQPFDREYRIQRVTDGQERWVHGLGRVDYAPDGTPVQMVGTIQDITERKHAEAQLSHLRNLLSNIINSMPSALVGVDLEGNVTQWNNEAEKVTGLPATEAIGQPLAQVYPWLAPQLERVRQAIRERQPQMQDKIPYYREGESHYADLTVYPLIANGVQGAVLRVDDVSERVRLEEVLIQSEKMLSVGGLAAGMAHEINNPLAGMLQNAQVLRDRLSPDLPRNARVAEASGTTIEALARYAEQREIPQMLTAIVESGKRAAEVVENMLNFSRKSESKFAPHNLAALCDKTLQLAESDYDLKKKYDFRHIAIVRDYQPDMPAVVCEGTKIQQVLLNLFKNGAQAMVGQPERPPQLTVRLRQEGDWARLEVEDNGPGLSEATRRRLFEPFFTTKEVGVGTGLGLSVSYFIITENHGGTIEAQSAPGVGARFIIRLPLTRRSK